MFKVKVKTKTFLNKEIESISINHFDLDNKEKIDENLI